MLLYFPFHEFHFHLFSNVPSKLRRNEKTQAPSCWPDEVRTAIVVNYHTCLDTQISRRKLCHLLILGLKYGGRTL